VISGHSHKPLVQTRDNVLFVNPGSAGPRRFKLPVTVGLLLLQNADVHAEIIQLL
jgi:predicted phosphodiesterase